MEQQLLFSMRNSISTTNSVFKHILICSWNFGSNGFDEKPNGWNWRTWPMKEIIVHVLVAIANGGLKPSHGIFGIHRHINRSSNWKYYIHCHTSSHTIWFL